MFEKLENALLVGMFKLLLKLNPPKSPLLYEGQGVIEDLADLISQSGHRNLLIVTTKGMMDAKRLSSLTNALNRLNIAFSFFNGVKPNPGLSTVEGAVEAFRAHDCDAIFAFGGGSVMDAAKAAALQIGNQIPLRELVGNFKARKAAVPLYAVPTTAGTGSEITSASVLSDEASHRKVFIFDHKMIPRAVALDPGPQLGLPSHITADTGLDALTHAIEAYLSKIDHKRMMNQAVQAVRLVFGNIHSSYTNGANIDARTQMAKASFLAGEALNHMGLGYVHAISHQLTARYNIPHGRANAILLPKVLRASFLAVYPQLAKFARASAVVTGDLGDQDSAKQFIENIEELLAKLGIPDTVAEIKSEDLPELVNMAREEARKNYPVPYFLSDQECKKILLDLMSQKEDL